MAEKSNAEAKPTGKNEFLMTEDPEHPSGSKEGSPSSGSSSSTTEASLNTINVSTQRLHEKLEDLERQMDQDEIMNEHFIRLMAVIRMFFYKINIIWRGRWVDDGR
uniref:Uncharacterized protein n=1 Tax=Drosophila melanogaster TaxID=7227 RepID=E1JJR7_DROME|nr:uncharacterized protein Dmel_CG42583 [Drosophila melanogaster]ACZ95336.1 uncharacterized protein Dmel_CG42583 [Drosophila melanogaster]|eukprot:NP_001162803.1 uncharacterized protein Dmel_CG42583 [Drosophila melanogaster]